MRTHEIGETLNHIFMVIPHYNLLTALYSTLSAFANHEVMPDIATHITYFLAVGTVLMCVLLAIDLQIHARLLYRIRHLYWGPPPAEAEEGYIDSDVKQEKERIRTMPMETITGLNLVLRDLTKFYDSFLAVNRLCVGISKGECFGLLGINGAGKTTTFKMLTGDERISAGDAWLNGLSLKSDMKKVRQFIGYCPQFDGLIDDLTGRETLIIYCLLRGVSRTEAPLIAERLSQDLNFNEHIDKKVKEYSGGNKRKLSTAVALVGDPPVIYLDEPTTGMDPATKRHLWNVACQVRNRGTCIMLTTHSMEECEALCTRLAVMVNGEFMCIGSSQHLKNKFSDGYTLTIKVRANISRNTVASAVATVSGRKASKRATTAVLSPLEALKAFVSLNFPTSVLTEQYQTLFTFYIPTTEIPWSRMFGIMESGKRELGIEDYCLSETTLEQVFLSFTRKQRPDEYNE